MERVDLQVRIKTNNMDKEQNERFLQRMFDIQEALYGAYNGGPSVTNSLGGIAEANNKIAENIGHLAHAGMKIAEALEKNNT